MLNANIISKITQMVEWNVPKMKTKTAARKNKKTKNVFVPFIMCR